MYQQHHEHDPYNYGGDGVSPRSPVVKRGDPHRGSRPVEAAEEPPGEGVGEAPPSRVGEASAEG